MNSITYDPACGPHSIWPRLKRPALNRSVVDQSTISWVTGFPRSPGILSAFAHLCISVSDFHCKDICKVRLGNLVT